VLFISLQDSIHFYTILWYLFYLFG